MICAVLVHALQVKAPKIYGNVLGSIFLFEFWIDQTRKYVGLLGCWAYFDVLPSIGKYVGFVQLPEQI